MQEESGVERITIDSDKAPHMVKVKGATRRSVEQARAALEYTVRLVPLDKAELEFFREGNYAKLGSIQTKSRVLSIAAVPAAAPGEAAHLKVLGLVGDVETAEALVESDLAFRREAEAAERAMHQMQVRLDEVKASYGEGGRRYYPQQQQQQQQHQQQQQQAASNAPQQQRGYGGGGGSGGGGGGGGGGAGSRAPAAGRPSQQAPAAAPQAQAPSPQQQQRRAAPQGQAPQDRRR